VGVSVSDLGNPFFVEVARGVEKKVAEIGGPKARLSVVSSSYDLDTQIRQIESFINAGTQMIVLNAADAAGILPAVENAKAAGIVVIAVDVAAAGADATVMSDNRQAGRTACEYMAERLGGEGDVVIVNGPPVSSVLNRVEGCKAVLATYPGIRVLSDHSNSGGSRAGGLTVMAALLLAYSKIYAVFTINDPTALGVDLAARQAGRREFFIVSVDGSPAAVEALHDEDSLIAATAAQDPRMMATRAVEIGYNLMNGVEPARDPTLIPTPLVTRENADAYKGWGGTNAP
jgi:ribose transport system substrate-binding protein